MVMTQETKNKFKMAMNIFNVVATNRVLSYVALASFMSGLPVYSFVHGMDWVEEVIWKEESSIGALATLVKASAGATTSNTFELFVTPVGQHHEEEDLVFRADKTEPVSVTWLNSSSIEICYVKAQIWQYTNFASIRLDGDRFEFIDIQLRRDTECVEP